MNLYIFIASFHIIWPLPQVGGFTRNVFRVPKRCWSNPEFKEGQKSKIMIKRTSQNVFAHNTATVYVLPVRG